MAEQIRITDVRIGAPRASRSAPGEQRLDLAMEVRNDSKKTMHVIASLRALDYDPDTRTLFVGLSEPELKEGLRPSNFVMPHTTVIRPGKSATLEVSVPLVIRKIVPSNQLGIGVETLDISDVQNVKSEIAYAPEPFYPRRSESAETMSRELRSWGEKVQKTIEVSVKGETPRRPKRPRKSQKEEE
jgi:hypothetical protein